VRRETPHQLLTPNGVLAKFGMTKAGELTEQIDHLGAAGSLRWFGEHHLDRDVLRREIPLQLCPCQSFRLTRSGWCLTRMSRM